MIVGNPYSICLREIEKWPHCVEMLFFNVVGSNLVELKLYTLALHLNFHTPALKPTPLSLYTSSPDCSFFVCNTNLRSFSVGRIITCS